MSLKALSSDALCELRKTVEDVFIEALQLLPPSEKHRTGAYFSSTDEQGRPLALFAIGTVPDDKVVRYMTLALEKPNRLCLHPDHVASSQSRNEKRDEWGGATVNMDDRVPHGSYFALSGLSPDLLDEAVCLVVAVKLHALWPEMAQSVADTTGNDYFAPLMDRCLAKK